MKVKIFFTTVTTISLATLISSCGILSPIETPKTTYYQILATHKLPQTDKTQLPITIFIGNLNASKPYNTSTMVYRQDNYSLTSYTLQKWASAPNFMLTQSLFSSLTQSQLFKHVVDSNFIGYSDYRVTGELNDFAQAILPDNESKIYLSINLTLSSSQTGKVIASKQFTLKQASKATPDSYAKVANELSQKFNSQATDWLYRRLVKENIKTTKPL